MIRKRITSALMAGIMMAVAVPALAFAAPTTEVVLESNVSRQAEDTPPLKDWVIYTRPTTPGTATFSTGPGTPPLGSGSLELSTVAGTDKVYAFNFDHVGTQLDTVSDISYSTYRSAGSLQQVAALNLQVDVNGDAAGGFTTLVFEPVYNTAQGTVVNGQWQDWDAFSGGEAIWWSSNPIPGAPNRDTFVSWNTILENNPDAVIIGGVGINQGSGNAGLTTAVDAFTFNETTYDFEPTIKITNKEDCKNGGWETSNSPEYKNQGDCVSAVASNDKAKGNPSVIDTITNAFRGLFN
jgi:hypothetical protein